MENLIKMSAEAAVPILLVGPPGVGKTATILKAFDHVEVVLTSAMVEEDIAGIPFQSNGSEFRTLPPWMERLQKSQGSSAVFFDELDKARRSVADTLLTLVCSRKIGTHNLPDRCAIVAAANPPDASGGDGISEAMISRFTVVNFVPQLDTWAKWALSKYTSPAALKVIRSILEGSIPIYDVAGDDLNKRVTSPRTIALVLNVIENLKDRSLTNAVPLIRGLVTTGVASAIINLVSETRDRNSSVRDAAANHIRKEYKSAYREPLHL